MKKIIFITLDSPYIDRRILLFAKSLQTIGYDCSVLTSYAVAEQGFEDINILNLCSTGKKASGIVIIKEFLKRHFSLSVLNLAKQVYLACFARDDYSPFINEMTKFIKKTKADIYIACDLPVLPVGYAGKQTNNAILIYDAHEFYTEQASLSLKTKKKLKAVENDLIGHADCLITVNNDIANLFKKEYLLDKIHVIMNATECCKYERNFLHDIIHIDRKIPVILYQGGFIPNRNLQKLVELSSYLKTSVLIMLGWGVMEKELKIMAENLGVLNKRIFFIPKIPQTELISYTRSATIGIIPYPDIDLNTRYCSPNKLFEFICAEIPIAANNVLVTVQKMLQHHNIGFNINLKDPKTCASKIEKIISNKNLMEKYKSSLQNAGELFNWSKEEKKLLNIFSSWT